EIAVLCRPHLVLADAGGDDGFTARVAVELLDDVVGLDQGTRAVVVHGVDAPQLRDLGPPGAEVDLKLPLPPVRGQCPQRPGDQPHVAPVHALDLVHLGAIDVQVRDVPRV